jgi:hypothetical protein
MCAVYDDFYTWAKMVPFDFLYAAAAVQQTPSALSSTIVKMMPGFLPCSFLSRPISYHNQTTV